MHTFATGLYDELCQVVRPGNGDQEALQVARKIREKGLDIEAPLVHAWGTHFGVPVIGMENWGPDPVEFQEGQLIVIEPNPCTPDTLLGIQVGNMTRVGAAGAEQLHTRGTELVVK